MESYVTIMLVSPLDDPIVLQNKNILMKIILTESNKITQIAMSLLHFCCCSSIKIIFSHMYKKKCN